MAQTWREAWLKKLLKPIELAEWAKQRRAEGKRIATLNGSFDLLHAGHLHIVYEAKQQADLLLVALNSDSSVRRYKSPSRPIIPLEQRLELMAAIGFIDFVTWFDEEDPRQLLSIVRPDVHVNGAEYGLDCIEAAQVQQGGGRLHLVGKLEGLSTSAIVAKVQQLKEGA